MSESSSRAATNELLAILRDGRWRPGAWRRFLRTATSRSVQQARRHPRALSEITLLHAAFQLLGARRSRVWTLSGWAFAATHLGMLEGRRSIGIANAVTLTRANLPASTGTPWLPLLALVSDVADGRMARALGTETAFGAAADSLADAAFWTWYALRHEPSRAIKAAALLAWALPVATVTAASVHHGQMADAPRPVVLRPAAAMQVVLTVRGLWRAVQPGRPPPDHGVSSPISSSAPP